MDDRKLENTIAKYSNKNVWLDLFLQGLHDNDSDHGSRLILNWYIVRRLAEDKNSIGHTIRTRWNIRPR